MSFENIGNTGDPAATTTPPAADPAAGNQAFLIVEDRAFRSSDDVAKHITHAQAHISTLEQEQAETRAKLQEMEAALAKANNAGDSAQQILDRLDSLSNNNQSDGSTAPTTAVSKEDLAAVQQAAVDQALATINHTQNEAQANANLATCMDNATAAYGENVGDAISKLAGDLGMTIADVDIMAKQKPAVFSRLFLPAKQASTGFTSGGVSTGAVLTDASSQTVAKPSKTVMSGSTSEDVRRMWDYCKPDNFKG